MRRKAFSTSTLSFLSLFPLSLSLSFSFSFFFFFSFSRRSFCLSFFSLARVVFFPQGLFLAATR